MAEGARLLSECAPKGAPWVRIPPSPPYNIYIFLDLTGQKAGFFLDIQVLFLLKAANK